MAVSRTATPGSNLLPVTPVLQVSATLFTPWAGCLLSFPFYITFSLLSFKFQFDSLVTIVLEE